MNGLWTTVANLSAMMPLVSAVTVWVVRYALLHPASVKTSKVDINVASLAETLKRRFRPTQFAVNVSAKPMVRLWEDLLVKPEMVYVNRDEAHRWWRKSSPK